MWAEDITKQVYEKWKVDYSTWKQGFKLFYGPVKKNPKLMILTFNPGGDENSFQKDFNKFEKGDFSLFTRNEYLTRNYKLAEKMQSFFEENEELLASSVTFPIIFWRSKSVKFWKKNFPKELQKDAEKFCLEKTHKIIQFLDPAYILILGFKTYSILNKNYGPFSNEHEIRGIKNRKIGLKAKWENRPLFCILHPSGARISTADWAKNKRMFFKLCTKFLKTIR